MTVVIPGPAFLIAVNTWGKQWVFDNAESLMAFVNAVNSAPKVNETQHYSDVVVYDKSIAARFKEIFDKDPELAKAVKEELEKAKRHNEIDRFRAEAESASYQIEKNDPANN